MSGQIVKEEIAGCYVDEKSFSLMYERLCKLDQICTGPFKGRSGRTGWLQPWTPVLQNADQPNTVSDWYDLGNPWTGPDCLHDININVDVGNHYMLLRRTRAYHWIDVQVLRNGAVCNVKTVDTYTYRDKRTDTNPDVVNPLHYEIWKSGNSLLQCLNSPASSVYQVQVRYRYQTVGSQTSAYFRYIGGLRSEALFDASPKQIVTGI